MSLSALHGNGERRIKGESAARGNMEWTSGIGIFYFLQKSEILATLCLLLFYVKNIETPFICAQLLLSPLSPRFLFAAALSLFIEDWEALRTVNIRSIKFYLKTTNMMREGNWSPEHTIYFVRTGLVRGEREGKKSWVLKIGSFGRRGEGGSWQRGK